MADVDVPPVALPVSELSVSPAADSAAVLPSERGRQRAAASRGRLRGVANEENATLSRIPSLGLAAALSLAVGAVAAADKPTTAADKAADDSHSGVP